MALLTKAPRGTQDILPAKIAPWQAMERELIATAQRFGFQEIRTPTFEHTELFNRSVGDTTDVVQKEMYTFQDKGDRSITLRPEGTAGAARVLDHLCGDCREHFDGLKARLDAMGIPYTVNPRIVRGLDYYTRTVFEFVSSGIGAQGTVCGGGRYDGLIQELGGPQTPALGFAMGLERLLLVLEAQGNPPAQGERCDLYVAPMGENASVRAFQLVNLLRAEGYYGETDLMGRSLRAQMKYADKLGCRFSLVLGDNELETGEALLKDMETGESLPIPLGEGFLEEFDRRMAARAYAQLEQSIQEELAGE